MRKLSREREEGRGCLSTSFKILFRTPNSSLNTNCCIAFPRNPPSFSSVLNHSVTWKSTHIYDPLPGSTAPSSPNVGHYFAKCSSLGAILAPGKRGEVRRRWLAMTSLSCLGPWAERKPGEEYWWGFSSPCAFPGEQKRQWFSWVFF